MRRVGGTWRDNTYPGAACDIPSLLYSFSFVENPTWSRAYSPADEIRRHIEDMVDRFDLRRRIEFGTEVNGLSFDEDEGVWNVTTRVSTGHRSYRARTVVLASGPLPDHNWPDVRGIDTYEGHKIHSARWDHDYDFTGKRVAVIGTGASAVQIVPELVKQAGFVKVFQRTPGWVIPRLDVATPGRAQELFAKVPAVQQPCPPGVVLGTRGQRHRAGVGLTAERARRPAWQGTPAPAGEGPVAAPAADTGLHARLQAHADLQ